MNYGRLTCPHCGGNMEIINMYSDHYLCDTCDYEINLDGVINKGTYDHVYCTDCKNFQPIPCPTVLCKDCPCIGCECSNPEDSMSIEYRPKYEPKIESLIKLSDQKHENMFERLASNEDKKVDYQKEYDEYLSCRFDSEGRREVK